MVEEDADLCPWRAFDLSADFVGREVLHCCAISAEMVIGPKAPVVAYLLDLERGVLLHVYDDRGMDLVSLDRRPLLPLYRSRGDWLLDYDRPRMAEAFEDAA
jgi:hypothetical protein